MYISEKMAMVGGAKVAILEYYAIEGVYPDSLKDIGLDSDSLSSLGPPGYLLGVGFDMLGQERRVPVML